MTELLELDDSPEVMARPRLCRRFSRIADHRSTEVAERVYGTR
jgi:hypothetical protein